MRGVHKMHDCTWDKFAMRRRRRRGPRSFLENYPNRDHDITSQLSQSSRRRLCNARNREGRGDANPETRAILWPCDASDLDRNVSSRASRTIPRRSRDKTRLFDDPIADRVDSRRESWGIRATTTTTTTSATIGTGCGWPSKQKFRYTRIKHWRPD